jgi:hypothetical protein
MYGSFKVFVLLLFLSQTIFAQIWESYNRKNDHSKQGKLNEIKAISKRLTPSNFYQFNIKSHVNGDK